MLTGTFTVDPLTDPLSLMLNEAGMDLGVVVAPHAQVFQELLDPGSAFSRNRSGVNILLVRFEDWLRDATGASNSWGDLTRLKASVNDLIAALRTVAASNPAPVLLVVCPCSPRFAANLEAVAFFDSLTLRLKDETASSPSLLLVPPDWLSGIDPAALHDAEGDRLAQLPYTSLFFAALGAKLARLIHALKGIPPKVLVLDCDGTLWRGAVGEEGSQGVQIDDRHRALQSFALAKKKAGMLLCLASKNVEPDVLEVFTSRTDMVLRLEDLVATRLNWLPKSENLKSLAAELNLGLDSFVFIDDNPVECAEIEANCPGVLVIHLPVEEDFPKFVSEIWPLDILRVTEEDAKRSDMYRASLSRDHLAKSATSLEEFLAGLELRIEISTPGAQQLARVAQLTHRTNQFNVTTKRRTEAEIQRLAAEGRECRAVEVGDRFGEYGLVGVMIFSTEGAGLVIDTLLLSCRVLGRGVEHAMMRELGRLAIERGLSEVVAPLTTTERNLPARRFLDSLEVAAREETATGVTYRLATAQATAVVYTPGAVPTEDMHEGTRTDKVSEAGSTTPAASGDRRKSARWAHVARDLDTPEKVLAALARAKGRTRSLSVDPVPPRTPTERRLSAIWAETLGLPTVGISDGYFDLGGTSLLAVTIFARIEREMGQRLPLALLTECPTVEALAARIDQSSDVLSLVVLNQGGSAPPLFLVHDADGETLLYRNLALRMQDRPVFGIQPPARSDAPMLFTRIEDLAAHYVAEIRKVRPHGPYLLGGLCAGGVLAFEMARRLEADHEKVHLAAVFDAADVQASLRPHPDRARRFSRIGQTLRTATSLGQLPRLIAGKARGYVNYEIRTRLRGAYHQAAVYLLGACLERDLPIPKALRSLSIRTIYNQAEARYRPKGVLREEIVLFRATSGEGSEAPYVERYLDPLLGWAKRSTKGVRAIDVPGGHASMLQEPNVAAVADALRDYLAECEAGSPNGVGAGGPPEVNEASPGRTPPVVIGL